MSEIKFSWDNAEEGTGSAYLHCNVLLSDGFICNAYKVRDGDKLAVPFKIFRRLLTIHGVQSVHLDRYKVRIERTRVVEWAMICLEVELAVGDHISEHQLIPQKSKQD